MTWQKWPDLFVDFGVQLYVPWKLSTGAILYRDVAYLTGGPFSQYFDALVFRLFGASVLTLVFANLIILALLLLVVYRAFYRDGDQGTALMACLSILLAFAFEHYSDYGIFNYVTPYSEEIYHGLVLSVLAVALLGQWVKTQNPRVALASGFCAGLVFLTKAEVFLALVFAVMAALLLAWRISRQARSVLKGVCLMIASGLVPLLIFFFYFLRYGTCGQSLAWTCWAWTPLLTTSAARDPFYRWCLGLDAPRVYLHQTFLQFAALAAILAVCAIVFRFCHRGWRALAAWVVMAAALAWPAWHFKWEDCGHCLPLLCLTLLILLCRRARKSGWQSATIFAAIWTIFSLVMLAKLGFNTRIWHYGFALAMPAFVASVYLLFRVLPDALQKVGVPRKLWRSFIGAFLGLALFQLTLGSKFVYQKKTVPIASGADRLYTSPATEPLFDEPGPRMADAFSWMEANTPANTTVAALPAGAMMNFLLRRANPSGYLRWNPAELAAFGRTNMTRAFEQHPPDYVLLFGVDNSEFGYRFFGDKPAFGQDLVQWIDSHYRLIHLVGDDWKKTGKFGIKILQFAPAN
jgi:4-amino-4-deoxy-L-arabinose transferase-like glycosyltransferase